MHHSTIIAAAIDTAPLNRGLRGADWVADDRNVFFVEKGDLGALDDENVYDRAATDVVLFDFDSDGVYEVHVLLASRGKAAVECVGRAFDMMFRDRGAEVLFGMVPEHRRDVAMMARWCGMSFIMKLNHRGNNVELFDLSREQWENRQ